MAPTIELHSLNDTVEIGDGVRMPRLGVGTYKAAEGYEAYDEVSWALELGYRGIDTAALYGNEEDVGRAVRDPGIPRDELFVATKVWNDDQGYEQTLKSFSESLGRLAMDHVDLYLIHWPIPSLMEGTWRAMQEMLPKLTPEGGFTGSGPQVLRASRAIRSAWEAYRRCLSSKLTPPALNWY
jgi:diketogulonate reductase-like aldo/keto reductase